VGAPVIDRFCRGFGKVTSKADGGSSTGRPDDIISESGFYFHRDARRRGSSGVLEECGGRGIRLDYNPSHPDTVKRGRGFRRGKRRILRVALYVLMVKKLYAKPRPDVIPVMRGRRRV